MEDNVNQYVLSLIELAKEDSNNLTLTEFHGDILAVKSVFETSKELLTMLKCITLTNQDKKNIIKEVFSGEIHPIIINFIKIIIDNSELCHINIICQRFIDLCNKDKEIKVATVFSKEILSKEELIEITNSLKTTFNYHFILNNEVDDNVELELVFDNKRFNIADNIEGGGINER